MSLVNNTKLFFIAIKRTYVRVATRAEIVKYFTKSDKNFFNYF